MNEIPSTNSQNQVMGNVLSQKSTNPDKEIVDYIVDKTVEKAKLVRTPETDEFDSKPEMKLCASKIDANEITKGIGLATSVLIALKGLAQAGFDVWDTFVERFGVPESKEEEQALKAMLAPNKNLQVDV
jgi:hypothetical protein